MAFHCEQCGRELPSEELREAARFGYRAGHRLATDGLGTGGAGGKLLGLLGSAVVLGLVGRWCKDCASQPTPTPRGCGRDKMMDMFWSEWQRGCRPQDHIRTDIPRADRDLVATALRHGQRVESWLGYANCRICGVELGSGDLGGHGFVWPEKAEHYVLEHDVWTPDCAALLRALRGGTAL